MSPLSMNFHFNKLLKVFMRLNSHTELLPRHLNLCLSVSEHLRGKMRYADHGIGIMRDRY